MPLTKPAAWAWAAGQVEPAFAALAADCVCLAPFWEGTGDPIDLISGVPLPRDTNRVSWATQDGMPVLRYSAPVDWTGVECEPTIHQSTQWTILALLVPADVSEPEYSVYDESDEVSNPAAPSYLTADVNPAAGTWTLDSDTWNETTGLELYGETTTFVWSGLKVAQWRRDGITLTMRLDGAELTVSYSPQQNAVLPAMEVAFIGHYYVGDLALFALWTRALTDPEMALVGADPFGLVRSAVLSGEASLSVRRRRHRQQV